MSTATAPAPPAPPQRPTTGLTTDRTVIAPRRMLPDREGWADAGFVLLLGAAALAGFAPTFTGVEFLLVGLGGLLIGVVAAQVSAARRWPLVTPVVIALVVFFLLGGALCLRGSDAPWPTPHTWRLLTDQVVFGWKDLLTTLPPVDGAGPLLTLPWGLGLLTGSLTMALARVSSGPRWLRALAPLPVPLALLSLVILLGLHHPQSVLVQGALFATALLAWLTVRGQRTVVDVAGSTGRIGRIAVAASLLVLTASAAVPTGLSLTRSDAQRVVLRDTIDPPFDIGRYPSPLASFRRYVEVPQDPPAENLYTHELFTINGVQPGTRVRFATLDSYDGKVWGASNNAIPGATDDTYQRVSSTIDNPVDGLQVSVSVTLADGYSGVWLPVVGALQTVHFTNDRLASDADTFRYNLATSTAVVPAGLAPGDTYSFTATLPDDSLTVSSSPGGPVGQAGQAASFLDAQASEWSDDQKSLMKRVFAVAAHLKQDGKYSDGVVPAEQIYHAGHFQGRLAEFVNSRIIAGDDEQYAATMALLANRVGVPARVVMGAVVPADGVVHGSDVEAWVEIQVADGSWRTLPTDTFMSHEHPAKLPPQSQQNMGGTNVPPPAPIPPPTTAGEQADVKVKANKVDSDTKAPVKVAVPGWLRTALIYGGSPLLGLLVLMAGIIVAKAVRRRTRRRASRVSARVVGGWRELVDHARDLGQPVAAGGVVTRREQSRTMVSESAPRLARQADSHVFGPEVPQPEAAESFWGAVRAERRAMSAAVSRWRRMRAAVSLRTFRRS